MSLSFITEAFASESATQSGSIIANLMPIVLIMVVFYFLLLRPQQKKMKEHQLMTKSLAKGNEVVFAGGIFGTVLKADDQATLVVEIAPEIKIKIRRDSVTELVNNDNVPVNKEVAQPKQLKAERAKKSKKD